MLFPFSLFCQTISVEGISNSGNSFIFVSYSLKGEALTDSISIINNQFKFDLNVSENQKYRLKFDKEDKAYFDFYSTSPITQLDLKKDITQSFVKNPSELQVDFLRHQEFVDKFWEKNKKSMVDSEELQDSINNLRITQELEYLRDYPNSLSSLESMELLLKMKYGRARYLEFKEVLNRLSEDMSKTPYAISMRSFVDILDKYHALKKLPVIKALDQDSIEIDTRNVAQGKYLLLDFWASWCVPCRHDHPALKELYAANRDRLEILQFSIDENTDLWRKAILEDKLALWRHVSVKENDLKTIRRDLLIFSVPVKILVDPEGRIIRRWEGADDIFLEEIKDLVKR
ncbi:TlpA disulfide reductase family protein [Sphingobacterium luzhongxinii]|nr:TlpA disulfide reductase family protein [Sphingobacterium sp. xlx-73]